MFPVSYHILLSLRNSSSLHPFFHFRPSPLSLSLPSHFKAVPIVLFIVLFFPFGSPYIDDSLTFLSYYYSRYSLEFSFAHAFPLCVFIAPMLPFHFSLYLRCAADPSPFLLFLPLFFLSPFSLRYFQIFPPTSCCVFISHPSPPVIIFTAFSCFPSLLLLNIHPSHCSVIHTCSMDSVSLICLWIYVSMTLRIGIHNI